MKHLLDSRDPVMREFAEQFAYGLESAKSKAKELAKLDIHKPNYIGLVSSLESVDPGIVTDELPEGTTDEKTNEVIRRVVEKQVQETNGVFENFRNILDAYKTSPRELLDTVKVQREVVEEPVGLSPIPSYHELTEDQRQQVLTAVQTTLALAELPPIDVVANLIDRFNAGASASVIYRAMVKGGYATTAEEQQAEAGFLDLPSLQLLHSALVKTVNAKQFIDTADIDAAFVKITRFVSDDVILAQKELSESFNAEFTPESLEVLNQIVQSVSDFSVNLEIDGLDTLSGKELLVISAKYLEFLEAVEQVFGATGKAINVAMQQVSAINNKAMNLLQQKTLVSKLFEEISEVSQEVSQESFGAVRDGVSADDFEVIANSVDYRTLDVDLLINDLKERNVDLNDVIDYENHNRYRLVDFMLKSPEFVEITKELIEASDILIDQLGDLVVRQESLSKSLVEMDEFELPKVIKQLKYLDIAKEVPAVAVARQRSDVTDFKQLYSNKGSVIGNVLNAVKIHQEDLVTLTENLSKLSKQTDIYNDGPIRNVLTDLDKRHQDAIEAVVSRVKEIVPAFEADRYISAVDRAFGPYELSEQFYAFRDICLTISNYDRALRFVLGKILIASRG